MKYLVVKEYNSSSDVEYVTPQLRWSAFKENAERFDEYCKAQAAADRANTLYRISAQYEPEAYVEVVNE